MIERLRVLFHAAPCELQLSHLIGIDASEVFPEEDRLDLALGVGGEIDSLIVEELDQRHLGIVGCEADMDASACLCAQDTVSGDGAEASSAYPAH